MMISADALLSGKPIGGLECARKARSESRCMTAAMVVFSSSSNVERGLQSATQPLKTDLL
jgi:hypothetical protein